MSICRQLHTIRQTRSQILDEMMRCSRVTATDKPARNELRIGVKCNPCPTITRSCRLLIKVAIPFLRINERPNLVALNTLALQIHKNLVLILRTSAAKIDQQLHNRRSVNVRHSTDGAE